MVLPIKLIAEFTQREQYWTTECNSCRSQIGPKQGYEVCLYADFGTFRHMISHAIHLCQECFIKFGKHKDRDIRPIDFGLR